jgi:tripeptidyl-peptidase-1
MVMRDFPALEKTLLEISDPSHPNYGKWLTKEEADALTATPDVIANEVKAWATSTGARCSRLTESFKCEGTVAQIEKLLNGRLDSWLHKTTGEKIIRTSMDQPGSIPSKLEGKVTIVTGLTQFPMGQRTGTARPAAVYLGNTDTDYTIVPETCRILYNATAAPTGSKSSSVGPIEFQGYPAVIQTDLDGFATNVGLPKWTIPADQTVGPFAPGAGAESALDEQYVYGLSPDSSQWYWTEADWQFEFAQHVLSLPTNKLPQGECD